MRTTVQCIVLPIDAKQQTDSQGRHDNDVNGRQLRICQGNENNQQSQNRHIDNRHELQGATRLNDQIYQKLSDLVHLFNKWITSLATSPT